MLPIKYMEKKLNMMLLHSIANLCTMVKTKVNIRKYKRKYCEILAVLYKVFHWIKLRRLLIHQLCQNINGCLRNHCSWTEYFSYALFFEERKISGRNHTSNHYHNIRTADR